MIKFSKALFIGLLLLCSLCLSAQVTQLNLKPFSSSDDAKQRLSNGSMSLNSSDLELGGYNVSTPQIAAIRFPNVILPLGANITNAYIQFSVDERDAQGANLIISAEQGNAARYTDANSNITNRTYTNSTVLKEAPAWNTVRERGVD